VAAICRSIVDGIHTRRLDESKCEFHCVEGFLERGKDLIANGFVDVRTQSHAAGWQTGLSIAKTAKNLLSGAGKPVTRYYVA
jgi:hypothetical protein